ncbi:hypothetical protein F4778DRAFT_777943 [Xylariomycetidae sp. FL2044]|nr:hypothetical protein F4778DRAFT_777943 [Xylariomycetidae sp. FL2044]
MVSIQAILASNARIRNSLSTRLVAVFIDPVSGIGEAALKACTTQVSEPHIYFIVPICDVSLLKNVDDLCRQIKNRESAINLLFVSSGTMVTCRDAEAGLHYPLSLTYYYRLRFVLNLLPRLKQAASLRRVVTVSAGTEETTLFPDDF